MAQINEAWRVLSDPARRAVYDAENRGSAVPRSPVGPSTVASPSAHAARHPASGPAAATPSKFPWRFMLGIAAAGITFVLVNAALTKPGKEPVPDNLMEVGSCVDILDTGDAKEVMCSGANDGVVADLRPANSICPNGTEIYRDRQGMGDICVRLADG